MEGFMFKNKVLLYAILISYVFVLWPKGVLAATIPPLPKITNIYDTSAEKWTLKFDPIGNGGSTYSIESESMMNVGGNKVPLKLVWTQPLSSATFSIVDNANRRQNTGSWNFYLSNVYYNNEKVKKTDASYTDDLDKVSILVSNKSSSNFSGNGEDFTQIVTGTTEKEMSVKDILFKTGEDELDWGDDMAAWILNPFAAFVSKFTGLSEECKSGWGNDYPTIRLADDIGGRRDFFNFFWGNSATNNIPMSCNKYYDNYREKTEANQTRSVIEQYLLAKSYELKVNRKTDNGQVIDYSKAGKLSDSDISDCKDTIISPESQTGWKNSGSVIDILTKVSDSADKKTKEAAKIIAEKFEEYKKNPEQDIEMYRRFYTRKNIGHYPELYVTRAAVNQGKHELLLAEINAGYESEKGKEAVDTTVKKAVGNAETLGAAGGAAAGLYGLGAVGYALGNAFNTTFFIGVGLKGMALTSALQPVMAAMLNPFTIVAVVIAAAILIGAAINSKLAQYKWVTTVFNSLMASVYAIGNQNFKTCMLKKNKVASENAGINSDVILYGDKTAGVMRTEAEANLLGMGNALVADKDENGCPMLKATDMLNLGKAIDASFCNVAFMLSSFFEYASSRMIDWALSIMTG